MTGDQAGERLRRPSRKLSDGPPPLVLPEARRPPPAAHRGRPSLARRPLPAHYRHDHRPTREGPGAVGAAVDEPARHRVGRHAAQCGDQPGLQRCECAVALVGRHGRRLPDPALAYVSPGTFPGGLLRAPRREGHAGRLRRPVHPGAGARQRARRQARSALDRVPEAVLGVNAAQCDGLPETCTCRPRHRART